MAEDYVLLAEARKLGELIGNQDAIKSYRELSRQLELDIGAKSLLEQFEQLMEQLSMKEASMQPIEIAEKQKAQSLQQSVAMHPLLKKLIGSQMEYMELMRKVQEAISAGINQPEAGRTEQIAQPASKLII
ncbi:MAG: YlbF family regulator [Phycisphaerae bacterium]|nr:YlbF family regulator [Phycisphaerae bacterium]